MAWCRCVVCLVGAGQGVWLAQAGTAVVHLLHVKSRYTIGPGGVAGTAVVHLLHVKSRYTIVPGGVASTGRHSCGTPTPC